MLDSVSMPNGSPPPAVTITVLPHAHGQQSMVNHGLAGGWKAVQQLLLAALHIAVAQEVQAQAPKPTPLITPATLYPRPDPRFTPERG